MPKIFPFRAIRPTGDKVHLVTSRSVFTYKKSHLKAKMETNPFTFLHVIHPEFKKKHDTKPNTSERFELVKKSFDDFVNQGVFIQDQEPALYLYQQTKNRQKYTGFITAVSTEDYQKGRIKIHEQTLEEREEIFKNYLKICGINAEPVLLAYEAEAEIDEITKQIQDNHPHYDFTTTDEIRHTLWRVSDSEKITKLQHCFENISNFYIADGHHRSSSSAKLFEEKGKNGFFMAFILPNHSMSIFDFNRVVSDLNGMSKEILFQKLEEYFSVSKATHGEKPSSKGTFTMYLEDQWYLLELKEVSNELDAQLLNDLVLSPILGIGDLRNDKRIHFVSGENGYKSLIKKTNSFENGVGFGLCPVDFNVIKSIADRGEIMPPKTTWIEPKLRSGLTILDIFE